MNRLLAASVLWALTWAGAAAQSPAKPALRDPNFRSLTGRVFRPDKSPAAGAIVKLKNVKTLQILSYITQEGGRYQFNNLAVAADYEVRAELGDLVSKKRGISVFDQRAEAVIDLKLSNRKKSKGEEPEKPK